MAAQLLTLALSLLIAAQQPSVPQALKDQAVSVAQMAIQAALDQKVDAPFVEAKPSIEQYSGSDKSKYTVSYKGKKDECSVFSVGVSGLTLSVRGVTEGYRSGMLREEFPAADRTSDENGEVKDCRAAMKWTFEGDALENSSQTITTQVWAECFKHYGDPVNPWSSFPRVMCPEGVANGTFIRVERSSVSEPLRYNFQ